MRRLRPLAAVTLVFLCWWAIDPWNFVQAKELERIHQGRRSAPSVEKSVEQSVAKKPVGPAAELTGSLDAIQRLVRRIDERTTPVAASAAVSGSPAPSAQPAAQALSPDEVTALRTLREEIAARGNAVVEQLEATGRRLAETSLPGAVQARQRQKLTETEHGLRSLDAALRALESSGADLPARLADAKAMLEEAAGPSLHNPLDPDHLPFRPADPTERTVPTQAPSSNAVSSSTETTLKAQGAAATPPAPEDLAETPEVQLTEGITSLAESLGSDPLAIYNWVRQNIHFVPTFGSIQGAEACRLSRECNAFDTASLLIGLLRASGVPARYVRGTVEVEPGLFRSALGDFTDTRAAARLASSGGIPTVLVTGGGGEPVAVRMEHAWVEAFVDYSPGRGAVDSSAGSGSTWVPLDATLKRTSFRAPLDLEAELGVDLQGLATDLQATGTEGNGGSSGTGLSEALAVSRIEAIHDDLTDFLATDFQDSTIGDLFGAVDIQAAPLDVLPASLPGRPLTVSLRAASLTPAARHQVTVRLLDRFGFGEQLRLDTSTVELAGKRLTLGYIAATPTDEATIQSFGGLLDTPPYLVHLKPVLLVEGEVVATGPAVSMGTPQKLRVGFREPDGRTDSVEHQVAAGTYGAIGLDLQRVSDTAVDQRTQKLEAARQKLGQTDVAFDDVMGEVLHLHGQNYFLQVESNNHTTAHQLDVVSVKRPAEMLTTYAPVFAFTFGSAVDVVNTGMNVDVRRYVVSVASRTGDRLAERNFVVSTGTFGSLAESAIFEQIHEGVPAVSAIRLIAEANNRDVPVFSIDQTNVGTLLPQLDLSGAVINDIRNAVAAGKRVITPQQELSFFDWNGVGYVVLDLATGAAGYLISGGLAGGGTADLSDLLDMLNNLFGGAGFLVTILAIIFAGSVLSSILGVLANVIAALGVIVATWYVYNETGSVLAAFAAFLYAALGAIYLAAVSAALAEAVIAGTSILAAVLFMLMVTLIVTLIVTAVIFLLTHLPQVVFRRREDAVSEMLPEKPEDPVDPVQPESPPFWRGLAGLAQPAMAAA